MNKQFSNQELKLIILDLYKSNYITITEELNKQLNKSSKIHYKSLEKIYLDIKIFLLNNISQSSNDNIENIDVIKKEVEIQTDIINEDTKYNEIIELKTELFNLKKDIADYKFKILNYKKIIKELNNKKLDNNIYSSSNNTDDEDYIKEKRKINYHQLPELSSYNIICELKKLNTHQLKQLYNKYFSNKLNRKLD